MRHSFQSSCGHNVIAISQEREPLEVMMNYREFLIYRHRSALPERQEPEVLNYVTWRNVQAVEAWRSRLRGCNTYAAAHSPPCLSADTPVSPRKSRGPWPAAIGR